MPSVVAGAGVFLELAPAAEVQVELEAEVLRLGLGIGLHLHDEVVAVAFRERFCGGEMTQKSRRGGASFRADCQFRRREKVCRAAVASAFRG